MSICFLYIKFHIFFTVYIDLNYLVLTYVYFKYIEHFVFIDQREHIIVWL